MRLVKYRGKWCVYRGRRESRHSLHTADKDLAEARFEEYKRQAHAAKETVGEIVEAYLDAKKDKASIAGMRDAWKAAKSFWQNKRAEGLGEDVSREYSDLRLNHGGVSTGTVRKELGVIGQALRWFNPKTAPPVYRPPAPPPKERHLSKPEYIRLLEACASAPHLKLFVQIALGTGARKGAILDLTWDRVDLERAIITLSKGPETNKRRATVPVNETLLRALKQAKEAARTAYVVEFRGKPVKEVIIAFRRACQRAGLYDVTPHTLRHTAAVWLAEAGIPMPEIAQFLGHSDMKTTYRIYARYSPNHLRAASKALEV